MANIKKIALNGTSYDVVDATAVHTVDSALSSSSTNPVQNKVVYSALKNQPHFEYVMTSGCLQPTNFSGTFPTTFSALVSHADFKIALRNPVIVHYLSLTGTDDFIAQGLLWFGVNTQITDEWTILFPDGVTFQGALTNGVTGTMSYDSSEEVWYLDGVTAHTPGYKTYTDDAIASIPAGSDTTYTFTGGTQSFTATPSQGTAQSVSIKPQIFKGTCSTAAATTTKVVTCPEFTSADLVKGAVIFVLFTNTNSGAVGSIKLNVNSTGAKNIKYMRNAAESNLPGTGYLRANMTYRFVYNGTYWVCDTDYDADTVTMLTYRTFRVASDAGGSLYSYKLCALDNNGDLIPFNFVETDPTTTYNKAITTHSFNPFRGFLYYAGTTTTAAGSGRDANEFRSAVQFDCRYSLNINSSGTAGSTALTAYDPIYVKALYTASTRLAQLVADTSDGNYLVRSSVVQDLPSANPNTGLADGTFYIYILLGQVYSKYGIDMFDNHPIYYWNTKAGMMTEFTGIVEANFAQSLHSHGDIDYAGAITTNPGTTIATGDSLLIADSSLGNTIKKADASFDTTDTSKFFRHDGTWASPVDSLDATISGLGTGKTITALSETNGVISASASNIAIDGSQVTSGNIAAARMPTGYMKEAYLEWGGKNFWGDNGPLDAALINTLGANRFAFISAAAITVEYSTDAGTTWTDYGLTDAQKNGIFAPGIGTSMALGKHTTGGSANDQLRITVDTYYGGAQQVYSTIKKMCVFVSTNGASHLKWTCQVRTTADMLNNVDTWTNVFTDVDLSGWSGINITQTNVTIGANRPTDTTNTQYRQFRYIFTQTAAASDGKSAYIYYIMGYGGVGWATPSNMAKLGSIYTYDANQNVAFPASVKAAALKGLGAAYYGTCTTAAATGDKVVACDGFVLQDGARIAIKFSYGNVATGAIRLNVNNTGLKTIICRGSTANSYNPVMKFGAGDVLEFIYNGANYILLDGFRIRELATSSSRLTSANMSISGGGLEYFNATSSMTTGKPPGDSHVLGMHWDNGELWTSQLAISNSTARIFTRAQNSGTWQPWREAPLFATNPTPGQVVVADASSGANDCQVKGVTLNVDGANFDGTNPVKHYGLTTLYSNGVFSIIDANYNNTLAQGFRMTINVAYDMSYDTGLKMNIRTSGTDVPGSGDKFIKRNGEIIKSLTAGEVLEFVYDGTDWQQVGGSVGDADVAEQLGEEVDVTDNVPYIYRPTGGDVLTGTSKYETLVGGTVAWNQLRSGAFPSSGCTHSISNGIITITPTSSSNRYIACDPNGSSYTPVIKDHVYLESVVIKSDGTNYVGFQNYQYLDVTKKTASSTWTVLADIKKASASGNSVVQLYSPSQTVYYIKENSFRVYDLTLMFGPTIANQLLSMETSTAGSGVAWFRDLFPSDYYPYNTGELLSVMPTAEKSVGFNLFDKTKIVTGYTNDGTGALISTGSGVNYKSTDFIHVVGGKTYYIKTDQVGSAWGAWYDASKKYISGITGYAHGNIYQEQTAPVGSAYMRLTCYVNTPDGNIDTFCVSISNSTKNGTYEPYKESTYPITPVELRGIPKLDSNNKLYYNGDVRNSDGTVTRKYKKVTIDGTTVTVSNFGATSSGYAVFYSASGSISTTARENANLTCDRFTYSYLAYSAMPVMTFCGLSGAASSIWFILPSSVTSLAEANAWFASNPTTLVYELASPTYEEVAAFPNPQAVDPYGVEEFVDERTVAMPVGHESRYVTNLREKLEEAPSVPVDDGRYVVEVKNGVSNYVRETVKVYRTTDPDFTITKDATPSSGSLYSGTVTDYTYDKMLADYQNGVIPMIVDDASILDPDEAFTFKFVSFYEDGDRFLFECDNMELRLYNQDDFTVYTKDYKSSSVPFYSCSTAINTAAKLVYGSGFNLVAGARIYVKFTYGNNANQPTLNINDTGGKYILSGGQYLKSTGLGTNGVGCYISPNSVLELIYDGTYWNVLDLRNQLFATSAYNNRLTDLNRSCAIPSLEYFLATSSTTSGKPPFDAHVLNMNWDNGTNAAAQLAVAHGADTHAGQLWTRAQIGTAATWTEWKEIPRLTSTPTNGQIMVSDQSTGLGLIKGGPAIDTTDTTKFLRHDGTWAEAGSGGGSSIEDKEVYLSRVTNFGDHKYQFPSLVGGTVAWNQLLSVKSPISKFPASATYAYSSSTGVTSYAGTMDSNKYGYLLYRLDDYTKIISGHKYYMSAKITGTGFTGVWLKPSNNGATPTTANLGGGYYAGIQEAGTQRDSLVGCSAPNGTAVTMAISDICVMDLTLMLGPTIANAVYSMEQATSGSGVAWFRNLFSKNYYPYNAGTLISVNPTGVKTTGVNAWDEEWEYGGIDSTTGANNGSATTEWRTKNYIPVIPGGTYYVTAPVASRNLKARFYDANKNYIGYTNKAGTNCFTATAFTVPDNASYVRFGPAVGDVTVPNHDFCVSISNPLYNGTYYPYTHHTYYISPVELRGIPKLDANNNLYYDGDVRNSDGTVTRKYGILDLGTYTWERLQDTTNNTYYFRTSASVIKPPANGNTPANMVCAIYTTVASSTVSVNNKTIGRNVSSYLYVRDDTYTSAAAFKTAMSGVYLVYERTTPTTEQTAPFVTPWVLADGGVQKVIDDRDVAMPIYQESTISDAQNAIEEMLDSDDIVTKAEVALPESGTCTLTDGMSISFTANYYKIGRQVTVWGTIPKYASTALGLTDLPYAASASMTSVVQFQNPASGGAMVSATLSVAAGYTTLGTIGYITGSSNNGMFVGNSTGSWLNLIPSTGLAFNFTYITDTP